MRICRISVPFPRHGGITGGLHPYHLSLEIVEPTLFITRGLPNRPFEVPRHVKLEQIAFPHTQILSDTRWDKWPQMSFNLFGQILFTLQSLRTIGRFKPDIIHLHSAEPILLGLAAKRLFGAKLIITFIGTDVRRIRDTRPLQKLVALIDRGFYVSPDMKETLLRCLPEQKLVYTPTGVDTTLFHPNGAEKNAQIVTIARLNWQKGHQYLISAFKRIADRFRDYKLLIVGEGERRPKLEEQVSRTDLHGRVRFLGTRSREEVARLLNESKIFVLPSVTEGMPKAVIESLACQTPVVVTDVGDCARLAQGAGIVVKPKDEEGLARAMEKILSDRQFYTKCVVGCQEKVADYDWQTIANGVRREYEKLLS